MHDGKISNHVVIFSFKTTGEKHFAKKQDMDQYDFRTIPDSLLCTDNIQARYNF